MMMVIMMMVIMVVSMMVVSMMVVMIMMVMMVMMMVVMMMVVIFFLKKVQLYKNQFSNANLTLGLLFNCYRPLITNLLLKLHIKLDISTTSTNKSRTNK